MNTRWLTNPFFMYSLSFLLVFSVYNLRWSDQYPSIGWALGLFLFLTFLISFALAFLHERNKRNTFFSVERSKSDHLILAGVYFGFCMDFVYSRGIPLVAAITGSGFSYKDFTGIPTFHVILSTFSIFYSVYLFHQNISGKFSWLRLSLFILSIVPNLLVLNRGAIMIIIIACFILNLMKMKKLALKNLMIIFLSFGSIIFLFGLIGNVRYSVSKDDKEFILRIGGASEKFISSNIAPEYYWGYLYIATPVGNLENIIQEKPSESSLRNLPAFAASELLPDFISKRLMSMIGREGDVELASKYFVIDALNAPTVYFRSYYLLGWTGMVLMYLYSAAVMLFYPYLIPKNSRFYLTGWACLVTLVLLNIFSNMWYASGAVLLWPIIASYFQFKETKPHAA